MRKLTTFLPILALVVTAPQATLGSLQEDDAEFRGNWNGAYVLNNYDFAVHTDCYVKLSCGIIGRDEIVLDPGFQFKGRTFPQGLRLSRNSTQEEFEAQLQRAGLRK